MMDADGFRVTQSRNRFLVVDTMQLMTEIRLPQARKILALSIKYSDYDEMEANKDSLCYCYEEIETRFKKHPNIVKRAKKLLDYYC